MEQAVSEKKEYGRRPEKAKTSQYGKYFYGLENDKQLIAYYREAKFFELEYRK